MLPTRPREYSDEANDGASRFFLFPCRRVTGNLCDSDTCSPFCDRRGFSFSSSYSGANRNRPANPPSLPPTVEEAYRRKCIQLRARTKEIEDENDAYRLRLIRLKRQIQKVRLERAILLEQIAKRTSTNVEDSDGSPSPPPTVRPPPLTHTPQR